MNSKDILQEVPEKCLPKLRDLLKVDWPSNVHACYYVQNAIDWKKKYSDEKLVTIYSPDGDWTDGTFLAIMEIKSYDIFVYTLDKSYTRLKNALRNTKVINWDKQPLFAAVSEEFYEVTSQVRSELGRSLEFNVPSNLWWIPREEALKFECRIPDHMYVGALDHTHADTINAVWPHRTPGSEKYIEKLVALNYGIGLFAKDNDELCAWVLKNSFNALGILQTADNHKQKGYGSLIAKVLSKSLAQEGYDPIGFVIRINTPSRTLFTSIGFKEINPVTWFK